MYKFKQMRASDTFTTTAVCSATFTNTFIYDAIIPFIPSMLHDRVGVPVGQLQRWTSILLAVYGAAFLSMGVVAGFWTDRSTSKKIPFLFGLAPMVAATLMFFLGTHIAVIVVARALQGISASLVWVSGLAYMTSRIDAKNVGIAVGSVTASMAVGELLAPVVGGVMYEHLGRLPVLWLVSAVLGVDCIFRCSVLDRDIKPGMVASEERALLNDVEGYTSGATARGLFGTPATTRVLESQSKHHDQNAAADDSITVLGVHLDRKLSASRLAATITGIVRFAFESTLVIFVSSRFGWSQSASGGITFALLAPNILAPLVGRYTAKHGPRRISTVAFVLTSALVTAFGFLQRDSIVIETLCILTTLSIGCCIAVLITAQYTAFSVVVKQNEDRSKAENHDVASSSGASFGSLNIAWGIASFIGPLLTVLILENFDWLALCGFLAVLSLLGASAMALGYGEWSAPE